MNCLGRTRNLLRCQNPANKLFCHHHRWQPYAWIISLISFIGVIAGLYQDAYLPFFSPTAKANIEPESRPIIPIEIPIHIESSWGEYSDLERKAEYFIYRPSSPVMQDLIDSGSARVLTPEDALKVNGKISISPHASFSTKVRLPKSKHLQEFLETGGYEIELVVFNSYGHEFRHSKQRFFDHETINEGFRYWFRLDLKQVNP